MLIQPYNIDGSSESGSLELPAIEYKLKVVGTYYLSPTETGYYDSIYISEETATKILDDALTKGGYSKDNKTTVGKWWNDLSLRTHYVVVDDFENGDEALDAIFENFYDLLLLDIRVPGMDGFTLVETIRKEGLNTPIIILTSLTDITNLSRGYDLGCNDYIRKPFDLIELKFRIEQLIKNSCFKTLENSIKIPPNYKFDVKKNILYKELTRIGYEMVEPGGTFYMFPKAPEPDAVAFCKRAMKQDLLLVPGDTFGCPGYFRMAYCIETEKVERSLYAFRKL